MKSGFVTLIGRPNVGKSTLMNAMVGEKIAITSNKPQTTRNRILAVSTRKEGQIVFLDTPGIVKARNKLGEYMVDQAVNTIGDVDLVLFVAEPQESIGPGEQHIAELLQDAKTPVILVLNKMDTLENPNEILRYIELYKGLYEFDEIVPVSARTKANMEELFGTIFSHLPEGPMYYDEDTVTDQPERAIVAEMIREKALHALSDEIPHGIAVTIESMKERKGKPLMDIEATIICERDSHKGIVIGKGGAMLKKIGSNARYEIERLLGVKVNLKLWVKVRKDWRDSDIQLKNFGYYES